MLNEWEHHELALIQESLARQDPELAARLSQPDGKHARRARCSRVLWAAAMAFCVPLALLLFAFVVVAMEALFFAL